MSKAIIKQVYKEYTGGLYEGSLYGWEDLEWIE